MYLMEWEGERVRLQPDSFGGVSRFPSSCMLQHGACHDSLKAVIVDVPAALLIHSSDQFPHVTVMRL